MKKLLQNWVGYADRSYEQIKRSVLARVPINSPELTDLSESNPLVLLISIFAAMMEILHLYIDAMAREAFIGTARRYTSVIKLSRHLDYRIKAAQAAYVDFIFELQQSGVPVVAPSNINIPAGTIIKSGSIEFRTLSSLDIVTGKIRGKVAARQWSAPTTTNLGTTNGVALQSIPLPDGYAHKTLTLSIGADTYTEYDSFGLMLRNTKGFIVECFEDGNMYIVFGDGINGVIPNIATTINGTYRLTTGVGGNIAPLAITEIGSSLTIPGGYQMTVYNPDYSHSGSDIQGLADVRLSAPKCLAVQRRAVTYTDYKDTAILAGGVGSAEASYCCADLITVYIAPLTRGIASGGLITAVSNFFADRKILGRGIGVVSAGITRIYIEAIINGNPGYSTQEILGSVLSALDTEYGYANSKINPTYKLSDITTLLDLLPEVDSLTINVLAAEPFVRPSATTTSSLSIAFTTPAVNTDTEATYQLVYDAGTNKFLLYKNTISFATITMGTPYSDAGKVGFTITDTGLYSDGDTFNFKVHKSYPASNPTNYVLALSDNSVGLIDIDYNTLVGGLPTYYGNITVNLGTTSSSDKCKPSC